MAHATRAALERQPDVVLGERGRRGARLDEIVELGALNLAGRRRFSGKLCSSVVIHQEKRSAFQTRRERAARNSGRGRRRTSPGSTRSSACDEITHVAGRQVQALGPGRRHDVARRRRRGTAGRSASARRRSCATARCSSRSTGPVDQARRRPRRRAGSFSSSQNALVGPVLDAARRGCTGRSSGCASASAWSTARSRARGWT